MATQTPACDAFVGSLLAGGLGDALGYAVEFIGGSEIVRRHGEAVPANLAIGGGDIAVVSDDTQMTLFTAEGMIRAWMRSSSRGICAPEAVTAKAYLRWYATQTGAPIDEVGRGWLFTDRRLHVQRAPGNTCMSALEAYEQTGVLPTVDAPPNDSKGCGVAMRVAPIGLCYSDRQAAFEMARDCGVITHGHPSGYWSGAYLAALIHDVVRGISLVDAMANAEALLANCEGSEEMLAILDRARRLARRGLPDMAAIESLGGGWVGEEAVGIALLCALTCDLAEPHAIEGALWRATAHSGDSDSTAAITGNILGAMVGARGLPEHWLAQLELRDTIERIATDLHRTWIEGEELSFSDYPPG